MSELRLINTYDQLVATGGGIAIVVAHMPGRGVGSACGWAVYRVNKSGHQVVTDPKAAWYDHGMKTFHWKSRTAADKAAVLEEAKRWISEHFGEHGPWVRNALRDYVPEHIAKRFPIRRTPKKIESP